MMVSSEMVSETCWRSSLRAALLAGIREVRPEEGRAKKGFSTGEGPKCWTKNSLSEAESWMTLKEGDAIKGERKRSLRKYSRLSAVSDRHACRNSSPVASASVSTNNNWE